MVPLVVDTQEEVVVLLVRGPDLEVEAVWLKVPTNAPHPSLDGHSRKIVTRELVYYILLGTLRSAQKCLWSNLRVEFSRDIHP